MRNTHTDVLTLFELEFAICRFGTQAVLVMAERAAFISSVEAAAPGDPPCASSASATAAAAAAAAGAGAASDDGSGAAAAAGECERALRAAGAVPTLSFARADGGGGVLPLPVGTTFVGRDTVGSDDKRCVQCSRGCGCGAQAAAFAVGGNWDASRGGAGSLGGSCAWRLRRTRWPRRWWQRCARSRPPPHTHTRARAHTLTPKQGLLSHLSHYVDLI